MSIPDLIAALEVRIQAAVEGDPRGVLNGQALTDAAELHRQISAAGGVTVRVGYVLGWFHWLRYRALPAGEDGDDLRAALGWFEAVHDADPQSAMPDYVRGYLTDGHTRPAQAALEILARVMHAHEPAGLDGAVELLTTAITAAPPEHPDLVTYLSNLGSALQIRFERTGNIGDLAEAVLVKRQAVDVALPEHPNLAGYLSNLGNALQSRFGRTGSIGDLDEAVSVGRQAVDVTPPEHPDLAMYLSNLGNALRTRFERTGSIGDLDEAVSVGRRSVDVALPEHPNLAMYLSNLGNALQSRFGRTGSIGDLDEAVSVGRQAADVTPPEHPDLAMYLSNLGNALRTRFERTGSIGDLAEAVSVKRQAVDVTPPEHPNLAMYLSNLGLALRTRFERSGSIGDLDEAVSVGRQAADITPPEHPNLAMYLSNLGSNLGLALRTRFERTGSIGDLDEAVSVGRQAADITPPEHPNLAMHLSNLGLALRTRFERSGSIGDLDEAVSVGRQAADITPPEHPNLAMYLSNLGSVLQIRFEHAGVVGDVREAVGLWSRAVGSETASVGARLRAAQAGALATARLDGLAAAVDIYKASVDLLPLLAWHGVSDADRRFLLDSEASSLARDGAACAIAAGNLPLAVEFLEQGRGVVWAQLLDTRTDLTDLEHAHPDLAEQLHVCRAILDRPTHDETTTGQGQHQHPATAAEDARRDAARRFDTLVAQVRALPPTDTFPDPHLFLRPPQVRTLLPADGAGHVVVVNVSQWRCDALILDHTGITCVELPDLTANDVIDTANRYLSALQDYERTRRDRGLMERAVTNTLDWLWDHITGPILERLGHTTTPADGVWPRVWWCPTGPVTVLPLHAAGHHTARDRRTVHDRVVSSYTPTLRALTRARTRARTTAEQRLLVLALPHTPDQSPLPGADTERQALAGLFDTARRTELLDSAATGFAITTALPRHQWLHASCHGTQNLYDPASGGLVPHDWQTAGLLGITDLTGADQPGGEFAFLSACKTATGGVTNLDEAINLAAALQYAGWRHVIGTLWSVWDDTAATVTEHLYPQLTYQGVLDPTHTARALHHTTRALRDDQPGRPSTWAPFIHTGP